MRTYLAFKDVFSRKKDEVSLKYFSTTQKYAVKIILNDFSGYPLYRRKRIGENTFKCGLGPLLENMMKFKSGADFEVVLVINAEPHSTDSSKYTSLMEKYPFIKKILFRDNVGLSFGAYNEGYQYLMETGHNGDVVFMNSSARGPYNEYWLLKYAHMFHRVERVGLCGVSLNSHTTHLKDRKFRPHVQSFFMYTSMKVLNKVFGDVLPGNVHKDFYDVVTYGEIALSTKILDRNYGICSRMFDNFVYYKGSKWRIPIGDLRYSSIYSQFANKI